MKTKIFIMIIGLNIGFAHAQTWHVANLRGVEEIQIHSQQTQQDYRIQAALIGDKPPGGYPSLYLLDGDLTLPTATLMMQSLSQKKEFQQGVLLVGIGYPNNKLYKQSARSKDYTPPQTPPQKKSGSAAQFQQFIQQELKPLIAKKFPINPQKQAIMGHSYGGLYCLYSLFNHPDDFSAYLISSPSIWWNNASILNDENKLIKAPELLRFSIGEYEQAANPAHPDSHQRRLKKQKRRMIDRTSALSNRLQKRFPQAPIQFTLYAKENHGSVIFRTLYDGLVTLYQHWYPQNKQD